MAGTKKITKKTTTTKKPSARKPSTRKPKVAGDKKNYVVVKSSHGGTDGHYTSKSGPAAAAKKAATRRFTTSVSVVTLTVRETGTDREFTYRLTRKKLPKPFVSTIAGKVIRREYTTEVKAI